MEVNSNQDQGPDDVYRNVDATSVQRLPKLGLQDRQNINITVDNELVAPVTIAPNTFYESSSPHIANLPNAPIQFPQVNEAPTWHPNTGPLVMMQCPLPPLVQGAQPRPPQFDAPCAHPGGPPQQFPGQVMMQFVATPGQMMRVRGPPSHFSAPSSPSQPQFFGVEFEVEPPPPGTEVRGSPPHPGMHPPLVEYGPPCGMLPPSPAPNHQQFLSMEYELEPPPPGTEVRGSLPYPGMHPPLVVYGPPHGMLPLPPLNHQQFLSMEYELEPPPPGTEVRVPLPHPGMNSPVVVYGPPHGMLSLPPAPNHQQFPGMEYELEPLPPGTEVRSPPPHPGMPPLPGVCGPPRGMPPPPPNQQQ